MINVASITIRAVPDFPVVREGDDLATLILDGCTRAAIELHESDVVVIAQKIVSKAEGRTVELSGVVPSAGALELAHEVNKDPRLVELMLSESVRVVRSRLGVLIVEHRLGYVMANAGIDQSNVGPEDGIQRALLLPMDPDASAAKLREQLTNFAGAAPAIIISDSFGRPWRHGTVGVAIGVAGVPAIVDLRGKPDMFGRILQASISAFADEIAAAASLVMGQADQAQPVVVVQGLSWTEPPSKALTLVRTAEEDLFR